MKPKFSIQSETHIKMQPQWLASLRTWKMRPKLSIQFKTQIKMLRKLLTKLETKWLTRLKTHISMHPK